jgi:hypothetical protein
MASPNPPKSDVALDPAVGAPDQCSLRANINKTGDLERTAYIPEIIGNL